MELECFMLRIKEDKPNDVVKQLAEIYFYVGVKLQEFPFWLMQIVPIR